MAVSSGLENELDQYVLRRTFFMITSMVTIKDASELLDIPEITIKQACQQERLLNTEKLGVVGEYIYQNVVRIGKYHIQTKKIYITI